MKQAYRISTVSSQAIKEEKDVLRLLTRLNFLNARHRIQRHRKEEGRENYFPLSAHGPNIYASSSAGPLGEPNSYNR
jgi:hypothetical protein